MLHRAVRNLVVATLAAWSASAPARAQTCPDNVPHLTGTWKTLPYQMPINPISASLLRTGKVLIVAGSENDAANHASDVHSYRNAVWDPTGSDESSFVVQEIEYDVFCAGTAQLPHGRVLVVGGTSDYSFTGERRASFFDPVTEQFVQSQSMADGRWYATATALGDGRLLAFSGLSSTGGTSTTTQIYDLANTPAGWLSATVEPFTPPLYPRAFLLPNGKVFFTGHGSGNSIAQGWIFDPGPRTWTASATTTRNRSYGTSVLLPLLPPSYTPKVMNLGGGSPATRTTEIIDLSAPSPSWSGTTPDMATGRIQLNAVLLPDGSVLAAGGSVNNEAPDAPGRTADLYLPTGSVVSAGTAAYSRLYHSGALLLPDATVASMGSNPGDRGRYLGAIEIYTPAYLYDANDRLITADRPAILDVTPATLGYGASFAVDYTSTSPIRSAVLVRPGSTTHAFDMEQRLVGLCGPPPQPPCASAGGTLALATPPNGNLAPPGYYMLFLVDDAGVPSVASFLELTPYATTPPDGTISAPASDVTITAGSSVLFNTTSTAAKYSWVFSGGSPATSSAQHPGNVAYANPGCYTAVLTLIDAANNTDPSPPTRMITVLPATANYEIEVDPPARTIAPGESATFTVSVEPESGFAGNVSLSVYSERPFPTGVTSGGFNPPTISGSGSSTLTINTTNATVPYSLSLTVKGTSGSLAHAASTSLLINLAPPQGLDATPADDEIDVSWQPSAGATHYRLGRSTTSGGPYENVACTTAVSYSDTDVVEGTTYYYVVTAQYTGGPNSGGASAESGEVSAGLPCPPVPPYAGALLASKSLDQEVTWSWTAGGAAAFDLVRGDLGALLASGGDFTAALDALPSGEEACLADDSALLLFDDPFGPPAPDSGEFLVLRPVTLGCPQAGSYDEDLPHQPASRDAGIGASSRSCP